MTGPCARLGVLLLVHIAAAAAACAPASPIAGASSLVGSGRQWSVAAPRAARVPALLLRLQGGGSEVCGGAGGKIVHATPLPLGDSVEAKDAEGGSVAVTFVITYGIDGHMVITGEGTVLGRWELHKAPKMKRVSGDLWELTLELPLNKDSYTYNYVAMGKTSRLEAQIADRTLSLKGLQPGDKLHVADSFRSSKIATLATAAFDRAIFGKGQADPLVATQNPTADAADVSWGARANDEVTVRFQTFAPRVEAGHSVWCTGSAGEMGKWAQDKAVPMVHVGRHVFVGQVTVKKSALPLEYKYMIADDSGAVVCTEREKHKTSDRQVTAAMAGGALTLLDDGSFIYPTGVYRSAGVAIPVSGLKSNDSMGVGEFSDLRKLVDWCALTGLQLIQVLPINDSGEDPSPYSASSSFALHPIYVRPREVAEYYQDKLSDKDLEGLLGWADTAVAKLNKSWKVMHASVMDEKNKLMNAIFDKVGLEAVMDDEGLRAWAAEQSSWLRTYAAFKVQLDKERGYNNKWWDCTTWRARAADADAIAAENAADWPQVARVYFTQYHLHVQLQAASRYAEAHGVALKGDIPIGVTRCSADVWAEPGCFKLSHNAGAPGDPEQNWGFPPYNWEEMHKDNCLWWRRRLSHMAQYFHAYRIDHILGFFRMWEIPVRGGKSGYHPPSGGLRDNGLTNLRAIQKASNMMICGEDLGDCPPEVGPVLLELGILGLKIQRWCEGHTWKYGYLSVAASSCHDCSPCRLWWNEEWGSAEGWYGFFCGGGAPGDVCKPPKEATKTCPGGPPPWVSKHIQKLHFDSTSMWTINPIQDYLDMWEPLRSMNAKNDIINRPGQTEGCWVWRCAVRLEKLLAATDFNGMLKGMLVDSERGKTY